MTSVTAVCFGKWLDFLAFFCKCVMRSFFELSPELLALFTNARSVYGGQSVNPGIRISEFSPKTAKSYIHSPLPQSSYL